MIIPAGEKYEYKESVINTNTITKKKNILGNLEPIRLGANTLCFINNLLLKYFDKMNQQSHKNNQDFKFKEFTGLDLPLELRELSHTIATKLLKTT
jgi:hypothetical protein